MKLFLALVELGLLAAVEAFRLDEVSLAWVLLVCDWEEESAQ